MCLLKIFGEMGTLFFSTNMALCEAKPTKVDNQHSYWNGGRWEQKGNYLLSRKLWFIPTCQALQLFPIPTCKIISNCSAWWNKLETLHLPWCLGQWLFELHVLFFVSTQQCHEEYFLLNPGEAPHDWSSTEEQPHPCDPDVYIVTVNTAEENPSYRA